ncbi:hypothetical protein ALC53_12578 [Atta colombica]|uniref:Uncharacterized protein n=1 Tax=Atta colombica TaxID=520822 RepID=A0A151HYT7_9HYME|nr:hypothetical protein ALC53_12578 [Atta colombica]
MVVAEVVHVPEPIPSESIELLIVLRGGYLPTIKSDNSSADNNGLALDGSLPSPRKLLTLSMLLLRERESSSCRFKETSSSSPLQRLYIETGCDRRFISGRLNGAQGTNIARRRGCVGITRRQIQIIADSFVLNLTASQCIHATSLARNIKVAEARRIRDGPPVDVLTTTTVLQLLLHCEPSAAVAALDARRNTTDVEVASELSISENYPNILPSITETEEGGIERGKHSVDAGAVSGSSSLCTRSLTIPDVVFEDVLEMTEIR